MPWAACTWTTHKVCSTRHRPPCLENELAQPFQSANPRTPEEHVLAFRQVVHKSSMDSSESHVGEDLDSEVADDYHAMAAENVILFLNFLLCIYAQ